MKKEKPLLIEDKRGKEILSVECNGDILLRQKKIGNDVKLADFLKEYGAALKKMIKEYKISMGDEGEENEMLEVQGKSNN